MINETPTEQQTELRSMPPTKPGPSTAAASAACRQSRGGGGPFPGLRRVQWLPGHSLLWGQVPTGLRGHCKVPHVDVPRLLTPVTVFLHVSGRLKRVAPSLGLTWPHVRAACLGHLSLPLPTPPLGRFGPTSTPGVGSLLLCCPDPASSPPMSPRHLLPFATSCGVPGPRQARTPRVQGREELE